MEVRFNQIMKIKHGYAFEGESYSDEPTKWSLLTPANFTLSGGFQETDRYYKEDVTSFPSEFILSKDDLIVTMTDLSKEIDTIGYSALVPESNKYLHNQRIGLVTITDSQIDKHYLYWLMRTKFYQRFVAGSSNGATVHHTSPDRIMKFKWDFPPLPTQQKIASILSAYDNLIQNYKKQIEALQTGTCELYKEWFVRFRFPGYQTTKFENGIPKGWSICRLKDFGKVITGKTPPTEKEEYYGGDVMFVKTPDMHGNMFVQSTSEYLSKLGCEYQKAQYLPENSIMVSCIGTGGITAINAYPANTNQQINSIILEDKKYLPWLYFTVSNMKETIEMFGNTGTTMTNLSKGKFEKLKVVKPEYSIIQTFENKVSSLFEQIKNLNKQITNLTQQRDLLLPRLMSGKLEVE